MKYKLLALSLSLASVVGANAQLVSYPGGVNSSTPVAATTVATGADATDLVRGSGLAASSGSGSTMASTDGRTTSSTFASSVTTAAGKYYSFTVTPEANYSLSFTSVTATGTASSTGPSNAQWGYSINNFAAGLGTASTLNTSGVATTAALTNTGITTSTEFRFVGFRPSSAGGSAGTFRITAPTLSGTATLRSAGTLTWDGGQGANWNTYNGTAANQSSWNANNIPAANLADSLTFAGSTQTTTNNNITGLTVGSITFAAGASAFANSGNAVTLNGGVTNSSSNTQTIGHGLALSSGSHTVTSSTGTIAVSGAITGATGSINKTGTSQLTLTGANTFGGGIIVTDGTVMVGNATTLASATGLINVNGGRLASSVAAATIGGNLTITTGMLDVNGSNVGAFTLASNRSFMMDGGTWNLDILSPTSFDQIVGGGTGTFTINAGVLDLTGSILEEGSYQIFSGFSSGSGSFGNIIGYDTDLYNVAFDDSTGMLNVTAAAVPEPHEYGIALALLMFVAIFRRRQQLQA